MRVDFSQFEAVNESAGSAQAAPAERTVMRKLTYETLLRNPELLWEIQQAARRERAAAIGDFFRRLFKTQARSPALRARLA